MAKFSRRTKIIAAFIIIVAVGYGLALFWQAENKVPAGFTAARLQGAIIAQTIVNNSNQSTDELNAINKYDQEGDYADALASTTDLINQSAGLRNEAVQLSTQVSADDERSSEHQVRGPRSRRRSSPSRAGSRSSTS